MAKYEGQYRDSLDDQEEIHQDSSQAAGGDKPFEETSFKKRYGDLRRHMQSQMSGKDKEIEELRSHLSQATQKQIKFPKSDSEVAEWVKKYPDVAKIIDSIAQRRVLKVRERWKDATEIVSLLSNLNFLRRLPRKS